MIIKTVIITGKTISMILVIVSPGVCPRLTSWYKRLRKANRPKNIAAMEIKSQYFVLNRGCFLRSSVINKTLNTNTTIAAKYNI